MTDIYLFIYFCLSCWILNLEIKYLSGGLLQEHDTKNSDLTTSWNSMILKTIIDRKKPSLKTSKYWFLSVWRIW